MLATGDAASHSQTPCSGRLVVETKYALHQPLGVLVRHPVSCAGNSFHGHDLGDLVPHFLDSTAVGETGVAVQSEAGIFNFPPDSSASRMSSAS